MTPGWSAPAPASRSPSARTTRAASRTPAAASTRRRRTPPTLLAHMQFVTEAVPLRLLRRPARQRRGPTLLPHRQPLHLQRPGGGHPGGVLLLRDRLQRLLPHAVVEAHHAADPGLDVVATNTTGDYTLLQLSQPAPSGTVMLGWSSSPIAFTNGASLYRISHPSAAPQAYSEHIVTRARAPAPAGPAAAGSTARTPTAPPKGAPAARRWSTATATWSVSSPAAAAPTSTTSATA